MSQQFNREQLEAMGLNEEQIKAILGATQEDGGSQSLPFPKAVINNDPDEGKVGGMAINPQKNEDGVTTFDKVTDLKFDLRILSVYYQFLEWDSNQNKYSVISDIKKGLAKKSDFIDIKTGRPVTEVGGDNLTFYTIVLCEIDGETVIRQMRGKYSFVFSEEVKKHQPYKLGKVFTIKHKKNVNGSVIFYLPEFVDVKDFDFKETLKDDADKISVMDKWVDSQNSRSGSKTETKATSETSEVDVDEDEIPFY